MMKKVLSHTLIIIFLILTSDGPLSAQSENGSDFDDGVLNCWTKEIVSREHGFSDKNIVKRIRFGRHRGYDRVVFDFDGPLPGFAVFPNEAMLSECWQNMKVDGRIYRKIRSRDDSAPFQIPHDTQFGHVNDVG